MTMKFTREDLYYCAEECQRQKSGELSVARMLDALDYLRSKPKHEITKGLVLTLGYIIDPCNYGGFREVPVMVNGHLALPAAHVPHAIDRLVERQYDLTPTEFYKEFELIHPFKDGNGRVGSLLYNFKNESLDKPEAAPDIF